jgi:hypothetical protein
MRIELTIKTTYLPNWKTFQGIRELLQNARDAEIELSAPMSVWHRKDTGVLCIENDGCTIPHEALLFGHTTKLGRGLAGKFGEGLKLAMLVLAREGHAVRIRSGSEVWTPKIERSDKFNADVLVVYVDKGRAEKDRVQIEVDQVSEESFEKIKDLFLFLGKVKDSERIKTSSGSLLLSARFVQKIFVKGIFVQNAPDLSYGYDLEDVEVDRDRKMVDSWDMNRRIASIWTEATASRPELFAGLTKLLTDNAADVAGLTDWNAEYLSAEAKAYVAKEFEKAYGADAIPVASLGESQDVEHLGKKGVVVPKSLRNVLEQTLGTVTQNKERLAKETEKLYGWHDLSAVEKSNLERALFLVAASEKLSISDVDVVDFRDPKLLGLFKDGRIELRKEILSDRDRVLRVLVHEAAHMAGGGDGEKDHVSNIERIWSGIVARLTREGTPS